MNIKFKYNEDEILDDFKKYVENTYSQHYIGDNNIQSLDLIFAIGRGEGFCIGNIIKYAARYKKKKGQEYNDVMKILHYALLLKYIYDLDVKNKVIETTKS